MVKLIVLCLKKHPAMKRAVTSLKQRSAETTFLCLSNSNEVYIGTILEVSPLCFVPPLAISELIHEGK